MCVCVCGGETLVRLVLVLISQETSLSLETALKKGRGDLGPDFSELSVS